MHLLGSTGGILAVLFGIEQNTIADAEQLYDKLVSKVKPPLPYTAHQKAALAWKTCVPMGRLDVWEQIFSSNPILQTTKLLVRQSYYDEGVWENVLRDMLGEKEDCICCCSNRAGDGTAWCR